MMVWKPLRVRVIIALVVLGSIVGVLFHEAQARMIPLLPTYGTVPPFELVDHKGQRMARDTLHGSVWVADFIFTRCAGQCPMMTMQMARLAKTLDSRDSVKLVSFTVDPAWDTPDVLAGYANAQGISSDFWHFVTGDPNIIYRLCREGFRLAVGEGEGSPQEPITHSVRVVLVDREGTIRGYYDATDGGQLKQLKRDLRRLLYDGSAG